MASLGPLLLRTLALGFIIAPGAVATALPTWPGPGRMEWLAQWVRVTMC